MSDTLSPTDAARLMADASHYEDALVQRAEGLTMMIWGIVAPGIFTSYAMATILGAREWVLAALWAPWVVAGFLTTMGLWRAVALERPAIDELPPMKILMRWLALTALIVVAFAIVRPDSASAPLVIMGIAYIGLGVFNPFASSPLGRRLTLGAGVLVTLAGAALILLGVADNISGVAAIAMSGAPLIVAGLYQTLRG